MTLTSMALRWSGRADVVADPTQFGERGVWCRADDVLPDVSIRRGQTVIAAWGQELWTAVAHWDDHDPELLWLIDGSPVERPSLEKVHALTSMVDRVLEIVGPTSPEGRRRIRELLRPIWRDTDGAPNALDARLLESRCVSVDVIRLLAGGEPAGPPALMDADPVGRLKRHAP